jgi:hypothetical protein
VIDVGGARHGFHFSAVVFGKLLNHESAHVEQGPAERRQVIFAQHIDRIAGHPLAWLERQQTDRRADLFRGTVYCQDWNVVDVLQLAVRALGLRKTKRRLGTHGGRT